MWLDRKPEATMDPGSQVRRGLLAQKQSGYEHPRWAEVVKASGYVEVECGAAIPATSTRLALWR